MSDDSHHGKLSFNQLLWFIPVVLIIHNTEEALTMPRWVEANLPMLREKIFPFQYINFSESQLYLSLVLVSIIPCILTALCLRPPLVKNRVAVLLVLQGIIFWNAFVPHLSGVVVLGMYNPGTVTAVFLNLPFSIYLFRQAAKEEMFTTKNLPKILFVALVLYLPAVYINHLLAEFIVSIL